MICPKCGTQNVDRPQVCSACGHVLAAPLTPEAPAEVRVSALALVSFALGLLTLPTLCLTALPAIIIGIIALIVIEKSGGRITGRGFAILGIVIPVFSLLLSVVMFMPALAEIRQSAFRVRCGTNLAGIGKAMLLYANDYQGQLPRAGGSSTAWGPVTDWAEPNRARAFGLSETDGSGGTATISSCFYLLVKYTELPPKSFICRGDTGTTAFKLTSVPGVPSGFKLADAWDFGPSGESYKHCSYSYHTPFGLFAAKTLGDPGFAVAADRNPWFRSPGAAAKSFVVFRPDLVGMGGTSDRAREGNAITHQLDGQNVMFLDTHVDYEKRAYCSVEDDNVYTVARYADKGDPLGIAPVYAPGLAPMSRKDSLLVHDPEFWSYSGSPRPATVTSGN